MAIFNLHINQQETNPVGGENIISGSLVYLAPDGKWYNTTATDKTKSTTEIKLAITNSISEDEIEFISYGEYVYPTGTLVAGAKYYISVLSGQITTTQYNNSTNVIRYVGTAKDTAVLLFNPDQTYISDYNSKVNDIIIQASNEIDNSHTHLEEDISDLDKYTMNEVDILTDSLGWKLNVDSIFKSKITNDNTVNFIGGTGVTLAYNAINNAITINGSTQSTPNLQEVTDVGNTTTNVIKSSTSAVQFSSLNPGGQILAQSASLQLIYLEPLSGQIQSYRGNINAGKLQFPSTTADRIWTLPDKSGTVAMTSDIPAYSIPNLQQVTNVGYITTTSLESAASSVSFSRITNQGFLYLGLTSTMKMDIIAFQGRIHSQVNSTFQNTLQFPENATAAWTQTLPSKSGTIALLSDITTGTGTVTSVGSGNGMNFTTFTTSGTVTLGTPSTLTAATTNALTANSHTHAITGFEPILGNPSTNGYVLSSTTTGIRSWVPMTGGTDTYPTTFGWTGGTSSGPTGSLTGTSPTVSFAAIPSASASASGVITTGTQTIAGLKTFTSNLNLLNANIIVTGGQISAQGDIDTNGFFVVNNTSGGYKITGKGADDILLASGGTTSLAAIGGGGGVTNLTTTHAATTVTINSDTGTDAIINGATATLAGVVTNTAQTFAGVKTFNNTIVAISYVRSGGTNVQFLMAGGGVVIGGSGISVDATSVKLGTLTSNWNAGSTYTITAADFIGSSDRRLKENIEYLSPKKINSIYKSFNFKTNKQSRIGVIAQELEIEHPEFVRIDEQGMKSVSYSDLHSAEIAYLKYKIENLEELVNKLIK